MNNIFLQNKYTNTYYNIINNAKSRTLSCDVYTEKHHIIPNSLGGDNSKDNLIVLTAREHFICHWLLTKMTLYESRRKMVYALKMMFANKTTNRYTIPSARLYQLLKIKFSRNNNGSNGHKWYTNGINNLMLPVFTIPPSNYLPGRTFLQSTKEKISQSASTRQYTTETKQKMSDSKKGKPGVIHTDATKLKMSNSRKGKKHSSETKQKLSMLKLGKKRGPYTPKSTSSL